MKINILCSLSVLSMQAEKKERFTHKSIKKDDSLLGDRDHNLMPRQTSQRSGHH